MSNNIGFVIQGYSRINRAALHLGAGSTIPKAMLDAYGRNAHADTVRHRRLGNKIVVVTTEDEGSDIYDFCVRTIEQNIEAAAEQDSLNNANK